MGGKTEKEILHILEDAIHREQAAQKLYRRGADLTDNAEIKKVLTDLAAEEEGHEKLIRELYHDYKKKLGLKLLTEDDDQR